MPSDDEDFVFYGTPIEREEEVTTRKKKAVAEASGQLRTALPPWKQEVTDEEGRRRFHGAFTGCYSTGYYNIVGSKEGWVPQSFSSSRKNRSEVKHQSIYNFLDEDEKAELEGRSLGASLQFDTFGFTAVELARKQAEKEQKQRPSTIPGPVPDELIVPVTESIGVKEREGFPLTSLREINILLSLRHPSVVDVKVVVGNNLDSIFMVMEYIEHDLKGLMETMKQPFSQSEVKCLMLQLLEGISFLHDNWVLHRDLKTSNLLLNNCGELKICDLGLARQYGSPLKPYTQLVVTLWYMAPELLLGAKQYSTTIDMWSLGCIMAELLSREPLFNGKTEVDQLDKIFKILGTPNETICKAFLTSLVQR